MTLRYLHGGYDGEGDPLDGEVGANARVKFAAEPRAGSSEGSGKGLTVLSVSNLTGRRLLVEHFRCLHIVAKLRCDTGVS